MSYSSFAIYASTLLSDGFSDLTGGAFQTCNGLNCITTTGNYAVDIVDLSGAGLAAPEPQAFALTLAGFAALGLIRKARTSRHR